VVYILTDRYATQSEPFSSPNNQQAGHAVCHNHQLLATSIVINKRFGIIQRHYSVCVRPADCVTSCYRNANGEKSEPTESEQLRVFIQALIHSLFFHSFIHSVVRLTTVPQPVPHTGRSSASSFNLQYSHLSLRSFSSCLRLFLALLSLLSFPPSLLQ